MRNGCESVIAAATQQCSWQTTQQNVPHGHNARRSFVFNARMSLIANNANKLWGIYHTDREYARSLGDPLRTTVEAPTKAEAEEIAVRLGFTNPWAHPVTPEVARLAEWILEKRPAHRQKCAHKTTRGIRI